MLDEHELRQELNRLAVLNSRLDKENQMLEDKLSFTGLTVDELQGIHRLIQGQIAFISKMQTGNDTHEVYTAVDALVSLASLVSKPTG